jgi:drug/metabolite transporter superfamily protein YnfA
MGILLILIGLLAPLLNRLKKQSPRALWAMISSAWIYPLGLLLQFAGLTQVGEALAALGAALAIAALVWLFRNLSQALDTINQS